MNILYLTNLYAPVVSGSSVQSMALAKEMVAQKNHQCIVVTARLDPDSPEYEQDEGVHVYRLPCWRLPKMGISLNFPWLNSLHYPGNFKRLKEIARKHEVDVIHIHNHMFDCAFLGRKLAKYLKKPVTLTLHTIIKHSKNIYNYVLEPVDKHFLGRCIVGPADAVICPDYNMFKYLQDRFGRDDGVLIPYGIALPLSPDPELRKKLIAEYNLADKKIMLSLGHLHALRNRIELIKAMPEVVKAYPDFVLVIVGAVTDNTAKNLVADLGMQDHVIFMGAQPREVVAVFHDIASIEGVWLDQDEEGKNSLGIAAMEGMLAGKPLLSQANINTFGEGVLKNGENVFCYPKLEAPRIAEILKDLLADPEKAHTIGQNAQETAKNTFGWQISVSKTEALYCELTSAEEAQQYASKNAA